MVTCLVNADAFAALPPAFKAAFETAANEQMLMMPAKYDAKNPDALRRVIAGGAELRAFPPEVMEACYKASIATFEELAAKSADFKRVYEHWKAFMNTSNQWFQIAEARLDGFRYAAPKW